MQPPRSLATGFSLLRSACTLAVTALSSAADAGGSVPAEASSAAAGSLLLLDRARRELTIPDSKGGSTTALWLRPDRRWHILSAEVQ